MENTLKDIKDSALDLDDAIMDLTDELEDAEDDQELVDEAWEDFDDVFVNVFTDSCDKLVVACKLIVKQSRERNAKLNNVLIWEWGGCHAILNT